MDAIVAERLTASPRIYDIYGFCGLGILSEFFPHGDLEAEITPEDDVSVDEGYDPQNKLSPLQKLIMAKQMADAVADMHGHAGGIIVHQDIQLSQFLWNADKTMVKLNDFNRAEFVLFDDNKKEYCGYWEGVGSGSVSQSIRKVMMIGIIPQWVIVSTSFIVAVCGGICRQSSYGKG